ncbi:hypothetical protein BBP40_003541 [Aspergillus hancockii]|nr:hypothetical protein BBP40_003541 [Aspergillus hancockii]
MSHNTLANGEWLAGGSCQFQDTADQCQDIKGTKMQDGDLCMYDNNGEAVWHTNTAVPTGDGTVICAVQNDGNAVLYKGTPIWSSHTHK